MTKQASDPDSHNKPCTLCHTFRPVLVRCQIDETGQWHFVCPGKCWTSVSGGEVDAKGHEAEFPHYRYGGMWKNRYADGPLNAKKPKKKSKRSTESLSNEGKPEFDGEGKVTSSAAKEEQQEHQAESETAIVS